MPFQKPVSHPKLFYGIAICMAVFIVLLGLRAPKHIMQNRGIEFQNIDQDWVLTLGNTKTPLNGLPRTRYGQNTATIQRTLPTKTDTQYLLFYTEHQEVEVSIAGNCIYRYTIPDEFAWLQTPGNTWHSIPLCPENAGQTISITFRCPFSFYQVLPKHIFYLYQGELQLAQAYSIWFCNTVAIFMLVLAVISLVSGTLWKSGLLKQYTSRLGVLYGLISAWLLTEINITNLLLGSALSTYLCTMLLVRLLPLSFYYFLQAHSPTQTQSTRTNNTKHPRWLSWENATRCFEWLLAGNVILPFVLQFTLGISLLTTLNITYALSLVGILAALLRMAHTAYATLQARIRPSLYDALYYANLLLLVGALGEIYTHQNETNLAFLRGTSISIAAIFYTIFTRMIVTRIETQFERETKALTQENNKLQLLPLMQQINAHFLFNTLNNISFLCKRDPKAADQSVILLAQYMREYMFLVNTSDVIPFSREQALMEAYLRIQQMRFKDKISFSITQNTPDFDLPPLCIQPFVENAIMHGVRNKKEGGAIAITSTQEAEYIKITVQDNGIGFDPTLLSGSTHVGIQNVQKRLALYGGWVAIHSSPSGTSVDIFIPQNAQALRPTDSTFSKA